MKWVIMRVSITLIGIVLFALVLSLELDVIARELGEISILLRWKKMINYL